MTKIFYEEEINKKNKIKEKLKGEIENQNKVKQEIENMQFKIDEINEKIDSKNKEKEDISTKIKQNNQIKDQLNEEINGLKNKINSNSLKNIPTDDEIKLEKEIKDLEKKEKKLIDSIDDYESIINELNRNLKILEKEKKNNIPEN